MAKIDPFYSTSQSFHHNNDACAVGQAIPKESRRSGTGGKPVCADCK